ncbi:MAG: hypothetical protein WDM81_17235 [Rhizomicrobium sp.]
MIKMLRQEDVWQPKRGAPPGNRNARKHGRFDAEARRLRRRIAALRRAAKALISRPNAKSRAATLSPSSSIGALHAPRTRSMEFVMGSLVPPHGLQPARAGIYSYHRRWDQNPAQDVKPLFTSVTAIFTCSGLVPPIQRVDESILGVDT